MHSMSVTLTALWVVRHIYSLLCCVSFKQAPQSTRLTTRAIRRFTWPPDSGMMLLCASFSTRTLTSFGIFIYYIFYIFIRFHTSTHISSFRLWIENNWRLLRGTGKYFYRIILDPPTNLIFSMTKLKFPTGLKICFKTKKFAKIPPALGIYCQLLISEWSSTSS